MAEIQLDHINKVFDDGTHAVRDISLTINDGEFFILLGPSGCGKSTLLNIIVGLEKATKGEVRVDDRVIDDLDPRDRNMAMVFQSYAIYPHMSVRDNLAFPLKLAGTNREEIDERVRKAAEILELEEFLHRMPKSLSGGQRQRVAMGRAIVRQPDAFLLDEPLSNLDAKLRNQMRGEIARLHEQLKTTMVYVTHDQTEAITLGQRLAVLRSGSLQQVGTPRALYDTPANLFVAGFIGSPAMNFFPGRVKDRQLQLPMLDETIELESHDVHEEAPQQVIVGLRPEHLQMVEEEDASSAFSATITLVEWLGADAYVHFTCEVKNGDDYPSLPESIIGERTEEQGLSGVVKLDPSHRLFRGDTLRLKLEIRKLHLFDPEKGYCIHRRSDQK